MTKPTDRGIHRWNADKRHRCPNCHAIAVSGRRPDSWHVYRCCRCGAAFTRWPWLGRILPAAGHTCDCPQEATR